MQDDRVPESEFVHGDDTVIGRAVYRSLAALVLLALLAAAAWLFQRRSPPPAPVSISTLPQTIVPLTPDVGPPIVRFTDITRAAGINFVHNNGAFGEKLLPETMGSGCAFFDYDGDGAPDLLFVNGTYWTGHVPADKSPTTASLFHNDGKGHFTDVTAGSGLDVPIHGMGVAAGDYDNDGRVDLLITGVGGNHLFHNEGDGKFTDVTVSAGVGGREDDWTTAAAFVDYDNDGRLDLFVCSYVQWTPQIDFGVNYTLAGVGRAYGPPTNFPGTFSTLFHNDGNGRFSDVSEKARIRIRNTATGAAAGKSLGVVPVDLDGDGWIDLVVANDTVRNFVFQNQRDGTFKEVGESSGIAFDSTGSARGAMGIDAADFRNDGSLAVGIGNFANEAIAFYVSHARRGSREVTFTDDAIAEGMAALSRTPLKFGLFFFDYDLDGYEDLLTVDGHIEKDISKVQKSQSYAQAAQLYWNGGSRGTGFVKVGADAAGPDLFQPIVGRGSAFADIDADGDLDVIFTQVNGPPVLLRNDQELNHHWLRLKVAGDGKTINRDAIGSWIEAKVGNRTFRRQVMPTRSYLSQSELPITLGLGEVNETPPISVRWSDGTSTSVDRVHLSGVTQVNRSSGAGAGR